MVSGLRSRDWTDFVPDLVKESLSTHPIAACTTALNRLPEVGVLPDYRIRIVADF